MATSTGSPTHDLQNIDLRKLKVGDTILIETEQHVWELGVIDPEELIVSVVGTDPRFRHRRPVQGYFLGSSTTDKSGTLLGSIVKGWAFEVRFADADLVSNPVVSARVSGKGWHYDAITA